MIPVCYLNNDGLILSQITSRSPAELQEFCLKRNIIVFFLPLGLLILLSYLIWLTNTDLELARYIYHAVPQWPGYDQFHWAAVDRFPWNIVYTYAPLPAFLLVGAALFIFIVGFFKQAFQLYRKQAVFLILLLAIGPGLIINVILKDNMGRARPSDIKEFGRNHQYSEPWQYGVSPGHKSFPSGHASVAFYLMSPWFIFYRRREKLAVFFLGTGLAFGLFVGFTRMLQGGHFLSDVIWAGGIVYLWGVVLFWILDPALPPFVLQGRNSLYQNKGLQSS